MMRSLKLITILFALLSIGYAQNIGCYVEGECNLAPLNAITADSSASQCLTDCKNNVNCKYWTFYSDMSSCYQWESCERFVTDCTDCISGDNDCDLPDQERCFLPGSCAGVVVGGPDAVSDPNACLDDCKESTLCKWWSFIDNGSNNGICTLIRDACDADVAAANCQEGQTCIYGNRNCDPLTTTAATTTTTTSTAPITTATTTGSTGSTTTSTTTTTFNSIYDCGDVITDATGILVSANYPSNYDNDIECEYIIEAQDANSVLSVRFTDLELEGCCGCDNIELRDGRNETAELISRICYNSNVTYPFFTTGSELFFRFESDYSITRRGFMAEFENVPKFELSSDTSNADFKTGILTSPNYPNSYPDSMSNGFLITVDVGETVGFQLNKFNLESCCDFLYIYDGPNANSPLIERASESTIGDVLRSTGNQMYVRMTTDGSITRPGFTAKFSHLDF